jgi:hypothetical protein
LNFWGERGCVKLTPDTSDASLTLYFILNDQCNTTQAKICPSILDSDMRGDFTEQWTVSWCSFVYTKENRFTTYKAPFKLKKIVSLQSVRLWSNLNEIKSISLYSQPKSKQHFFTCINLMIIVCWILVSTTVTNISTS